MSYKNSNIVYKALIYISNRKIEKHQKTNNKNNK